MGKTTLTAAMAFAAASMGLRAAVLDLDLMFGNMYDMVGVDEPNDLASLAVEDPDFKGIEAGAEATAMRCGSRGDLVGAGAFCLSVPNCFRVLWSG